jgi:hypothetical protein
VSNFAAPGRIWGVVLFCCDFPSGLVMVFSPSASVLADPREGKDWSPDSRAAR